MPKLIALTLLAATVITCTAEDKSAPAIALPKGDFILNLYDAFGPEVPGTRQDFGFSALIRYRGKLILFDSGTDANILKQNVEAFGVDLRKIDFAVASHSHFDHISGFDYVLSVNPKLKIYFPPDPFWGAELPFDITGRDADAKKDLPKEQQYFGGTLISGQLWQQKTGGRFRTEAEIDERRLELRVFSSVHQFTVKQHRGPYTDCRAVDRSDQRLARLTDRGQKLKNRTVFASRRILGKIAQIVATGKTLGAAVNQYHPDRIVLFCTLQGCSHFTIHLTIDGIELFRSINPNPHYAIAAVGINQHIIVSKSHHHYLLIAPIQLSRPGTEIIYIYKSFLRTIEIALSMAGLKLVADCVALMHGIEYHRWSFRIADDVTDDTLLFEIFFKRVTRHGPSSQNHCVR